MTEGSKRQLKSVWIFILYACVPILFWQLYFKEDLGHGIINNIWILFVFLAAMFNAAMDTLVHHYGKSIFTKYPRKYFDPSISWLNKYPNRDIKNNARPFVQFSDAWHFFKSSMILCWAIAVITYKPLFDSYWGDLAIIGIVYNNYFTLFYDHLLIKKEN